MKEDMLKFHKLDIKWLSAGIILIILGFIILGWNNSGVKTYEQQVFAWHKLTLAPILLLAGYALTGFAIMKKTGKRKLS